MNNLFLLLYPLINVIVTGLFAGVVLRQYGRRHRLYQLYWAVALGMAFLATLAYVLMTLAQPTSGAGVVFFRIYYILGAALTSSWLGLGSIVLVAPARVTRICFVVLCLLSVLAHCSSPLPVSTCSSSARLWARLERAFCSLRRARGS